MKKICIYGLGAIGGLIAGKLSKAGYAVSAIARGNTLSVVSQQGIKIQDNNTEEIYRINVTDDPKILGLQDLVIISVKTSALPEITGNLKYLIGKNTIVLSAMNGVPWWFLEGNQHISNKLNIDRLDPDANIKKSIPTQSIIGCVTHLSASTSKPGIVRKNAGNKLIIGEIDNKVSQRAIELKEILIESGFDVEIPKSIHQEIWFKLWGNMTMNPMSFITEATGSEILGNKLVRDFLSRCMTEATKVGEALGLIIDSTPEERHLVTEKLGAFKTSMLQDFEAKKRIELDALLTVVIDLSDQLDINTNNLKTLYGITRLKAEKYDLY